jgi:sugar-specific transcriptional regulator TrmB
LNTELKNIRAPPRSPEKSDDSEMLNHVMELCSYGLTTNQARLYLFMLGKPPLSASVISKGSGMHRVEVYRKLGEMESLGMVERYLGSPVKFKTMRPSAVLSGLVDRMDQKISMLRDSSGNLQRPLEGLESIRRANNQPILENHEYRYSNAAGREEYLMEIRRLIADAKHEIMSVTSANGMVRGVLAGNIELFRDAAKRGIRTRMITEVNKENTTQARGFARVVDLRHSHNVNFRFHIFDRAVTILSTRFDDNISIKSARDDYFVFKDAAYSATQSFLFEHLWETGVPFEKRIREIA